MTTGHNFWDASVWSLMIELTILLVGMLTANMLRRLIKPLRQSLIPSSVLGGFLILFANIAVEKITGGTLFNKVTMETLTYHGLGLGFVAMALRSNETTVLYKAACVYCKLGKKPEALEALRHAAQAGFKDHEWARRDPDLALLHGDPGFESLYPETAARG